MSYRTSLELVRSLLGYCGIDAAGLEEENKALLSFDEEVTILISIEDGLVHFVAFLGSAIDTKGFYLGLLQENFKSCSGTGVRYSTDPDTGELLMSLTVQSEGTTLDQLLKVFERFIAGSERWSNALLTGNEEMLSISELLSVEEERNLDPPPLEERGVSFLKA